MRRKYFGLAMAAIATLGPAQGFLGNVAFGGDREIAQAIHSRLKASRDAGELKNFNLDMKVDEGVVLFRGNLAGEAQRQVVLAASEGLDGVRDTVDELTIQAPVVKSAKIYKSGAAKLAVQDSAVFAQALTESPVNVSPAAEPVETVASVPVRKQMPQQVAVAPVQSQMLLPAETPVAAQEVVPGVVMPTAAFDGELTRPEAPVLPAAIKPTVGDDKLTDSVAKALGRAKAQGHLKSFGVDVNAYNGVVELEGSAASEEQRRLIGEIAKHAPGAVGVRNMLEVKTSPKLAAQTVGHRSPTPAPAMQPLAAAPARRSAMPVHNTMPMRQQMPMRGQMASYGGQYINGEQVVPGSMQTHGGGMPMEGSVMSGGGAPVMGQPVPMAPSAPAGAPRYDSPNLPNYAWPGYAAYPNYAALSYPQQYSPSAFPYIGPFYPYPQVPLGWRKVSLEWDDGWWMLDFTDK